DRLAERLAEDVPEGDVDGAHGGAQNGALEVGVSGDDLEMVLDAAGVLPDVVLAELLDRLVHQRVVGPQPGLARPDDPLSGVDPHQQARVVREGLDWLDLHWMTPGVGGRGFLAMVAGSAQGRATARLGISRLRRSPAAW